tara:strand:+ start:245 stop:454 length:210 start_codon:yes stop_codon:yes gene_type:complete
LCLIDQRGLVGLGETGKSSSIRYSGVMLNRFQKVAEYKWRTIREVFHDFQIGAVTSMAETEIDALTDDK